MTLQQKMAGSRSNNLNFIKFIAALLVIYSHSFYVCYGGNYADPLKMYTGIVSFGGVAVCIFLFSSGLYVSKSLEKCRSGKIYFGARFIRIFPLLIVVILATTFVLGPIVTTVSLKEYFTSISTYRYLLYIFLIPAYELTGVFVNNPATLVNGSLWTLILEVMCYIALYILYKFGFFKKSKSWILVLGACIGVFLLTIAIIPIFMSLDNYLRPLLLFFIGMLYYIYRDKIKLNKFATILSLILLVISFLINIPNFGLLVFLPYILINISYAEWQCPNCLSGLGKYSYGIYLVAYPVQQTLRMYITGMNPIMNTLLASMIAIFLAIVLNKFIEEPCIELYNEKWRK